MTFANKYDWKHITITVCALGAVVAEDLGQNVAAGVSLPWHLTAGSLLIVSTVFGHISKSLSEPSAPPVVIAVSSPAEVSK